MDEKQKLSFGEVTSGRRRFDRETGIMQKSTVLVHPNRIINVIVSVRSMMDLHIDSSVLNTNQSKLKNVIKVHNTQKKKKNIFLSKF